MAYDHEEQEQLEAFKHWWKQYGNLITWALIVVLAGYAAWSAWRYYQRNQSTQAAQLFSEMEQAVTSKDNAKIERIASDMSNFFPRTAYAAMANLIAAKTSEVTDPKKAQTQLEWVIEHGKDEQFVALAKLRLWGILLDQKSYDSALKLFDGSFPSSYAALVDDRRGDIYFAQNHIDAARTAYAKALALLDANSPGRQLVQLKLDALGGAPATQAG